MTQTCKILPASAANIEHCAELLRAGAVVAVPTETVYGLAGNALCEASVRQIFAVKERPLIDPLIVHFSSCEEAEAHVHFNSRARELAARFWPGALTLVLPKKASIPDVVTAGLPSVAVRVPGHPTFRRLLQRLDFPLAAPSANPFGYISPTRAEHVAGTLGERIPAVLDSGSCEYGVESTIVDLRQSETPRILRSGPISAQALGLSHKPASSETSTTSAQSAPGLLTQHYSPHTPITLFPHGAQPPSIQGAEAVLYNSRPAKDPIAAGTFWLSENGTLTEMAHNLFMRLQELDAADYTRLHVERVYNAGIGLAINDRLTRAAAKHS